MKYFYLSFCLLFFYSKPSLAQKTQKGVASFYADKFNGRLTANGERFSNNAMTAAHLTLKFNTMVRVTNLANNKSVVLRINDRGPYVKGRIIDLSKKAAKLLDYVDVGLANVKIEILSKENTTNPVSENHPTKPIKSSEYYEVKTEKVKLSGFGIQVGSYAESANMMREVNLLEASINKSVYVEVANVKKKKVYRISVGTFSERAIVERKLRLLKKKYKDSFIVTY